MKNCLYLLLRIVFFSGLPISIHAQIISTIAGSGVVGYTGSGGAATLARLDTLTGIAVDNIGDIYISEQKNNWIRKISPSGVITRVAGRGGLPGYSGDGGPATDAKLSQNWGIATDNADNLYIADIDTQLIRKVNPAGIITTIAGVIMGGGGVAGYSGDGGPATLAKLNTPLGIAVDSRGNIFIGDDYNYCIRRIDPSGNISLYAGTNNSGYSGDGGPATLAQISWTYGLATDLSGNLFLCDGENNCVRKINTAGIITTIAGNGIRGFSGDNGPATSCQLNKPTGVYADNAGYVYIADFNNHRIRKIDPNGIITTFAGKGSAGFSGDGGLARSAELNFPISFIRDGYGNSFIADLGNARVRKIDNTQILYFTSGAIQDLQVCQDAHSVSITSLCAVKDLDTGLTITWHLFHGPFHGHSFISTTAISNGGVISPPGLYYAPDTGFIGYDTVKVSANDGIAFDTTTIIINVKPQNPTAGIIRGANEVCVNSTIILRDSIGGGVWTMSNNNIGLNVMDTVVFATGHLQGVDTITYTFNNSCGVAVTTKTITVHALPDAGKISGFSNVCIGDAILLTETVGGGKWTITSSLVSFFPFDTAIIITGLTAGVEQVNYSVADAYCTNTAIQFVTVSPIPYPGTILGPKNVCVGSVIELKDSIKGGTWSSVFHNGALSPADTGVNITGTLPGIDIIVYTVHNYCGSGSAFDSIIIEPLPTKPAINKNENVLSVNAVYSSYQWTLNDMDIPGATNDSYTETISGNYGVMVTNLDGCSVKSDDLHCTGCNPNDIVVFPNPTTGIVHIDWCRNVTVRLICADGKSGQPVENVNQIDMSKMPDGVYFLEIFDEHMNRLKSKIIDKLSR